VSAIVIIRNIGYSEEATPHGMRSAFKDWCAEVTKAADDVSEAALAHKIPQKVRAAYLRTVFLEERKKLMASWAEYCASKTTASQTPASTNVAAA